MPSTFLGIDIGVAGCTLVLGPSPASILHKAVVPGVINDLPTELFIKKLLKETQLLLSEAGINAGELAGVGIVFGGTTDPHCETVRSHPGADASVWDRAFMAELLKKQPEVPACFMDGTEACTLAEWLYGAGQGVRNMVFVTLGPEVAAGIILDGSLYRGTNRNAGKAGLIPVPVREDEHVRHGAATLNDLCSTRGIARRAQSLARVRLRDGQQMPAYYSGLTSISDMTVTHVIDAAHAGDKHAQRVLNDTGRYLGRGLAILVDVVNPDRIVIGGAFASCQSFFEPYLDETLTLEALSMARLSCAVVPSAFAERSGEVAALTVAVDGRRYTELTGVPRQS